MTTNTLEESVLSLFNFGRQYQIVIDLTKKVNTTVNSLYGITKYRREEVQLYITELTEEEIKKEAQFIIETNKKHHRRFAENGWNNFDITLPEKAEQFLEKYLEDNYDIVYLGRCVQFLLDTNAKLKLIDLLNNLETVQNDAHELRETLCYKWFKNQESNTIRFKAYCNCEYIEYDEYAN